MHSHPRAILQFGLRTCVHTDRKKLRNLFPINIKMRNTFENDNRAFETPQVFLGIFR